MSARQVTPQKAVRKGQKARVALAGPAGSGKTWTALEVATVLSDGGPVVVVDTERGSSNLYADDFAFEVVEWDPPYDPRELAQVVPRLAEQYAVVVVDSLSHFWEGEGGTRDIVDQAAARSRGNSFAGWKEGTPAQNTMVGSLLSAPCHVLVTMRAKTEYVLEPDDRGKQVPRKIGTAPIQRPGIEFEFTVTADLDQQHLLVVDKTRCSALAGQSFRRCSDMAETLSKWLDSAEPLASREQVEQIRAHFAALSDDERKAAKDRFASEYGIPEHLTRARAADALASLGGSLEKEAEPES